MTRTSELAMVAVVATLLLAPSVSAQTNHRHVREPGFFPFSVCYSGGKARAPMLSVLTPESREEWRRGGSDHVITSHAAISSLLTTPHMGERPTTTS